MTLDKPTEIVWMKPVCILVGDTASSTALLSIAAWATAEPISVDLGIGVLLSIKTNSSACVMLAGNL